MRGAVNSHALKFNRIPPHSMSKHIECGGILSKEKNGAKGRGAFCAVFGGEAHLRSPPDIGI